MNPNKKTEEERMKMIKISLPIVMAVIALASTNAFATPISLGGGGVLNLSNVAGKVVAINGANPCIAFSGTVSPCTGVTPDLLSGGDPLLWATRTIKGNCKSF